MELPLSEPVSVIVSLVIVVVASESVVYNN